MPLYPATRAQKRWRYFGIMGQLAFAWRAINVLDTNELLSPKARLLAWDAEQAIQALRTQMQLDYYNKPKSER